MFLTKKARIAIFIISLLAVIIIIVTIIFAILNYSRAKDLQVVSQTKILANSLEIYFSKFNDYPVIEKVKGDAILTITENGINENGEVVYFKKSFKFTRPVNFESSIDSYKIDFNLKNKWPLWDLNTMKGGYCSITKNMIMKCK